MDDIIETLARMRNMGVRLWVEQGTLRYQAPKGTLTSRELAALRELKADIIRYLTRSPEAPVLPARLAARSPSDRVPLAFQQQSWWNLFAPLGVAPGCSRSCASATRISGALDLPRLQVSIEEVVRRHESLRTRIVRVDGYLLQYVDEARSFAVEVSDLSAMRCEDAQATAKRLIEEFVGERIDVALGPLFAVRVLKLGPEEHVLVVALTGVVADGFSIGILLREIWTWYRQLVHQLSASLAQMPMQFPDYAVWQYKTAEWWRDTHGPYWEQRLSGAVPARFQTDGEPRPTGRIEAGAVPVRLGRQLSERLRELSRRHETSLVVTVLTAYVAAVLRWQRSRELVLAFIVDGRHLPELANIIGCMASQLYLSVQVSAQETLQDLLRQVIEEYRLAWAHHDFGRLCVHSPGHDFRRSTSFNWPTWRGGIGATQPGLSTPALTLDIEPFPFDTSDTSEEAESIAAALDRDPAIMLCDSAEGVCGSLSFRPDLFRSSTMEGLARNFRICAEQLVQQPWARAVLVPGCRS